MVRLLRSPVSEPSLTPFQPDNNYNHYNNDNLKTLPTPTTTTTTTTTTRQPFPTPTSQPVKSYLDLEIYKIALALFFETHSFSLKLPKFELYELGSQLRRSSDSINSNIVEGYGRRRYKNDFIKFLVYSHSSNLECKNHLIKIIALYPELKEKGENLIEEYDRPGIKIHNFIEYVEKNWKV